MQRPKKQGYKQEGKKTENWLDVEFPGITERAKAENVGIFFGDETGIQNTASYDKGYAPIRRANSLLPMSLTFFYAV